MVSNDICIEKTRNDCTKMSPVMLFQVMKLQVFTYIYLLLYI